MNYIGRIRNFFKDGIWTIDEGRLNPLLRNSLHLLRQTVITVECFANNHLYSYAAALTYSCILAAVPILSIIFAIAKGFGFGAIIEARIRENISADEELVESVFGFVNQYLEHTHSGVVLGVGLLLLLYTVVMLTSNIETAFNTIWHVRSSRNVYRKVIDYASIFLLFPILIVVTSGFSVFLLTIAHQLSEYEVLSNTMEFMIKSTPVTLSCLCFIALYKFMPNTRVKWKSVAMPGIVSGVLFQILQYFYIHYQLMLSGYNAIYGSFAALPLFMLWLQFSWYLCLGGAQMSYAIQHDSEHMFAKDSRHLSRLEYDSLSILLMAHVAKRFRNGEPAYSAQELVEETELPHSLVQGLIDELVSINLLSEIRDEDGGSAVYQPSIDIRRITVDYVIQQLDDKDKGHIPQTWAERNKAWQTVTRIRSGISLRDGATCVADLSIPKR